MFFLSLCLHLSRCHVSLVCGSMFYLQRLDLAALTRDQGPGICSAVFLYAIHSIDCFDHHLDNSVKAGIECGAFNPIFDKATDTSEDCARIQQSIPSTA